MRGAPAMTKAWAGPRSTRNVFPRRPGAGTKARARPVAPAAGGRCPRGQVAVLSSRCARREGPAPLLRAHARPGASSSAPAPAGSF